MHYLKRDPGYNSVLQWSVQHRQTLEAVSLPLDKHILTGSPVVVSSITVLTADELAMIFEGGLRIVCVAERIDTRRSTALGDIHFNTLKLLAPAFREWAKAPVADAGDGVDVGKLTAERDTLRDRLADMTVELAGLRAGVTGPVDGADDDEEPVHSGHPMLHHNHDKADGESKNQSLPEGPALWDATARHFVERSPIQAAALAGSEFAGCDDGTVTVLFPGGRPGDAVIAGLEDSLMAIGQRKRSLKVMAPVLAPGLPAKPAKAPKP